MKRIGLIGCGNMGKAILVGLLKSEHYSTDHIMVSEVSQEAVECITQQYGIQGTTSNVEVAQNSDIIILAVKPNIYSNVVQEIKEYVTQQDKVLVTIAAGVSIAQMESWLKYPTKIIRTMPNTPLMVGAGMTVMCANEENTYEDVSEVKRIFESGGQVEMIHEKLMDAIPAISGSSPAYVFMFIEALADGAVMQGIPRKQAYTLAAQSVLGAAKMVLELEEHPGVLKDQVCSPAGTTIEAVHQLEKYGLRNAVIEAMKACTQKAIDMQKR